MWVLLAAALVAVSGPDPRDVARAVRERGFYAGETALGADGCAGCHADIAAQWAQSAHRFASFNNPYYAVSAHAFRRERGEAGFRFCARCHDLALLAAGRIGKPFRSDEVAAQAGIACLGCHSVVRTHGTIGNGGLERTQGPIPVPTVSSDKAAHAARLRPAVLATAELCAGCHKVGLTEAVTHDVWLRGQDDYDAWRDSAIAGQGAGAVRRPKAAQRCQDCHMPLEPAPLGDRGAHDGKVRSHRFLAANAALPHLRGDADAEARIATFLQGAVSLDLVTAREDGGLRIDVVVRNRRVGHRFPGGTGDSNEAWLEVELVDAAGRTVARAGGMGASAALLPDTHLFRAQPVDEQAEPIARRDPQHMRGVVWDTSLSPADPQVVCYRLTDPPAGPLTVRARVRYRKFAPDYAAAACAAIPDADLRRRCQEPPIVEVARAERAVGDDRRDWEGWLDHGLGLARGLVERASAALPSLLRAQKLAPDRVEPLLGLARLALAEGRTDDVLSLGAQIERRAPEHPASYWLRAQALDRAYRQREALAPLERLCQLVPRDREALLALGRARSVAGDHAGALAAADRVLAIDAESEDGHYLRMLALRALGRPAEAPREQAAYLRFRRPVERDQALRLRYRALHPERADEAFEAHEHVLRRLPPATAHGGAIGGSPLGYLHW
jgi:tetratricopeptide (TPR) repeat protein